jgi:peroxiredoxin
MCAYESDLARFNDAETAVLGISIDAQPSKAAWAKTLGPISFDLLSDFYPHGDVARKYGVFREKDGISERALFLIDKQGKVAWSRTYDIPQQPGNDELFAAIATLPR